MERNNGRDDIVNSWIRRVVENKDEGDDCVSMDGWKMKESFCLLIDVFMVSAYLKNRKRMSLVELLIIGGIR